MSTMNNEGSLNISIQKSHISRSKLMPIVVSPDNLPEVLKEVEERE